MNEIHWLPAPEAHDYPAAQDYLELLMPPEGARRLVAALRAAPIQVKKAKDLLRASDVELLPFDNPHVASDLRKIGKGTPLSPLLLVRGQLNGSAPLEVVDGYHRLCAAYRTDENSEVPCKIADVGQAFDWRRSVELKAQ